MSDGKPTQDAFEQRVTGLLRASASELDAATSAQLARARRTALQATGARTWPGLRYLVPAGAMAAALLLAVILIARQQTPGVIRDAGTLTTLDIELFSDAEAWELAQEPDLEFIEWAAASARAEGAGG